ncbi:MAG: hypothetical protein GDA49_08565 [Rhodospirillales bacterium]|nr:hypothetical protein [Rhodospirillales bacterium]
MRAVSTSPKASVPASISSSISSRASRTSYKRTPNYFKEDRANFENCEIYQVADVNAREAGLQTGQFDAVIERDSKTVDFLAQNPNMKVEKIANGRHITLPMHVDVAPYDDINARLALKYAMAPRTRSMSCCEAMARSFRSSATTPGRPHRTCAIGKVSRVTGRSTASTPWRALVVRRRHRLIAFGVVAQGLASPRPTCFLGYPTQRDRPARISCSMRPSSTVTMLCSMS